VNERPVGGQDAGRLLAQLRIDPAQRETPAGGGGSNRRRIVIVAGVALALAALAAAVAWWSTRPVVVEVATAVAPGAASGPGATLQASGYVTARRQATVSAQITGTIREVLIEEGEHVKAGQVLARLDDAAYQAGVAQARAQLLAAQALELQYQGQLAQAQRDTRRSQELIDRGLASRQSLELSQTQEGTLAAQLQAQRKQVELAQATLHGAEVQLGYCTVRAPFDGVVVAKSAQSGEIISPISAGGGFTRTGVGTIVDMDSLEIEVDVNEAYIHRVVPPQAAQAVLDAYPDWTIPAHVIAIIPTADRNKATVKVRVGLDQKDPRILPDMGVRVSFLERSATGGAAPPPVAGVLVPASAIVNAGGRSIVYALAGGRAHATPVTPGQGFGELRAVTGLDAGARVVRAPPAKLRDGGRVATGAAGEE